MKIKLHIFLLMFFLTKNLFAKTGQSIDSWVWVASAPAGAQSGVAVCATNDAVYVLRGSTTTFWKYVPATNSWVWLSSAPAATGTGADLVWTGGDFIYATRGAFTGEFWEYHILGNSWTIKASLPVNVSSGCSLAWTGGDYIYATQGDGTGFYMYSISQNIWFSTTSVPYAIGTGSEMTWAGGNFIYMERGGPSTPNMFYWYSISGTSWTEAGTARRAPGEPAIGASLIWNGGTFLFRHRGAGSGDFHKYCLTHSSWNCTQDSFPYSDPADTLVNIGSVRGQRLACVGDYIYCFGGTGNTSMLRYRWRDVDPPGKITGFVAITGVSGGTINLSWVCPGNDVNDLGNYVGSLPLGSTFYIQYSSMTENVVFSTSSPQNVYSVWIPTGPIAQGQKVGYTISNLVEGATYYFRIWARDNAGNWSEISDGATTWAQYTPLASPPESLTAISISSTAIKLVWISSTGAVAHRIEHSSVSYPSYNWISRSTVSLPTQEYTDVGLIPGVTYWYRIIAINSAGRPNEANPSNVVSTITYTAAPQNFSAYKVWVTSIVWRWETLGFADGFRIYRATDNSLVDVSSTTEYLEKNLSTNTAYGRYVRAYNIMGESLNSNHATFYTLAAVPTELQILEVYSSSVTIKWNNNTNPEWTRYGVAVAEDENFTVSHSTKYDFQHNLTAVSTTVFGLGGGTTYYFRVWAYNGDGIISGYSNVVSTVTLPGAPSAPTWLVGVALSTISLRWEWNIVRNATYYQIYDGQTGQLLANLEGTGTTTWIDVNLSSNTRYYRYVKAGNQYGLSAPSDIVSKYTLAYPPESLNVVSKTSSTVTLFWNDSGAFKYEIRRSTDGFFTQVVISTVSQTSFVDIGLIPGATYWYRVYAVNYDSETTTAIYAGVSTRTLPSPVVNFSVVTRTTSTITWSWSMSAGADGYKIYRANDDFYLTTVSAVQYVATGLSTNTVFGIYVVAFNTSGESLASPKSTCYTLAAVPSNLVVTNVSQNSVSLSWSHNGNPSGTRYEISYSLDSFQTNFSTPIKFSDNFVDVSTTISGLKSGTNYYFRARAINEDGIPTNFSNIVSTTTLAYFVIKNPGFEEHPLIDWEKVGTASKIVSTDTVKHSGTYSCVFVDPTSSFEGRGIRSSTFVVVSGNVYYVVGAYFYVKKDSATSEISASKIQLGIEWLDVNGVVVSTWTSLELSLKEFNKWEFLTCEFDEGPPNTYYGRVLIRVRETIDNDNDIYIDDVSLEVKVSPWIIKNPGFELFPQFVGWEKVGTASSIIITTNTQKTGNYSCLFKDPTSEFSGRGIKSSVFDVESGMHYRVGGHFYVMQDSATSTIAETKVQLGIVWLNSNKVDISTSTSAELTLSGFHSWEFLDTTFSKVPDSAAYGRVLVWVREKKNYNNDICVDDILLEKIPAPPGTLPKPQEVKGRRIGDGTQAELWWSTGSVQDAWYYIYRSTSNDINTMNVFIGSTTADKYKDTGYLDLATTYYYSLKVIKKQQQSDFSDIFVLPSDNIKPTIEHVGLTLRALVKKPVYIKVGVKDFLAASGDDQGRIYYLKFRARKKDVPTTIREQNFSSSLTNYSSYYYVEIEFPQELITTEGIQYNLETFDGRWVVYWPGPDENSYYTVELSQDKPEQKFITPTNPEVVFGKETEEVVIRDYSGNEVWRQRTDGTNFIIWRGDDKQGRKVESGAYIYQIKTKDGKRKYGVVIVVK